MPIKVLESAEIVVEQMASVLVALDQGDRAKIINPAIKRVGRLFIQQGGLLIDRFHRMAIYFLQRQESEGFSEGVEDDFDAIWDEVATITRPDADEIFERVLSQSVVAGYKNQAASFGVDASFELANPNAVSWAREHAAIHVTQVDDTTKGIIRNIVTDGLEKGESFQSVGRKIKAKFTEFAVGLPQERFRSRAELVAVTENAFAYESGGRLVANEMGEIGIQIEKFWGGPNDSVTSDGCLENIAAGWIPKDDAFPSGDQQPPRFPGCRHSALYQVVGGEEDMRDKINVAKAEKKLEV